jgi:small subunit ribosomal protein S21
MSKREETLSGNTVYVQNENIEKALRLLKKKVNDDGKLKLLKEREQYEKPSVVKRRTKNQQVRRAKKKLEQAYELGMLPDPSGRKQRHGRR